VERQAAGKPVPGTIVLEVSQRAGAIAIEVSDDGRGIDLERVGRRAVEAGIIDDHRAHELELGLIFEPGVSSAPELTSTSGRGVGLDVVRDTVHALAGTIDVRSELGRGTTFSLQLPLTLVSLRTVTVRAGGRRYGLPIRAVERVVRSDERVWVGSHTAMRTDDGLVVAAELMDVIGSGGAGAASERSPASLAVVLRSAAGRVALMVDAVEAERDLVLKDLGSLLGQRTLFAGAAVEHGDRVLLILDPAALVERGLARSRVPLAPVARERIETGPPHILVVDDSITTRTLERNILAAAGFRVSVAVDGLDALDALRSDPADLVLSDVDMPRLDGVGLVERMRRDERIHATPIVLLTAKDRPEDRERGLRAGANTYLTKGGFDHEQLLSVIQELVG
jgi:CheY-like chemotaxis protein